MLNGEESKISYSPLIPLVANRRDQLCSSGLHASFLRRSTSPSLIGTFLRGPELDNILKKHSHHGPIKGVHRPLVLVAKYWLCVGQDILGILLSYNILRRALEIHLDDHA